MIIRLWRLHKTRKRRQAIHAARERRLTHERFERETRELCLRKGRDPNCPYEKCAAAWELAAKGWKEAADAWSRVI